MKSSEALQTSEAVQYDAGSYDVIVVGAGHAGSEAALAAARMGNNTLLVTINLEMVAFMPCNPSVGGPAKGIVVREIDKTYVQMRMLNTGKGPAVRALRAQADKHAYHRAMKQTIEEEPNLTLHQATVDQLIVEDGVCKGVVTNTGARYHAKTVVLTVGTAARGKIIIGELQYESGPNNSKSAVKLSENSALTLNVLRPVLRHVLMEIRLIMMQRKNNQGMKSHTTLALIHQIVPTFRLVNNYLVG